MNEMYQFDEYLGKHVIITTKNAVFEGILLDCEVKDDIPYHCEEPLFCCVLSTAYGIIEIPEKDVMDMQADGL